MSTDVIKKLLNPDAPVFQPRRYLIDMNHNVGKVEEMNYPIQDKDMGGFNLIDKIQLIARNQAAKTQTMITPVGNNNTLKSMPL